MEIIYSINARLAGGGIGDTAYYAVLGSYRAQCLKRVICSSSLPREIPREKIHSLGLFGRIQKRIASVDRSGRLNDAVDRFFDDWSSAALEECDLLHCWSDLGRTLTRGKAKKAVTVLECMAHPATLKRILERESNRWGVISPDIPSSARLGRSLKEIDTADWIAVPSEFNRKTHLQNKVQQEKIRVVPYGVDTRRFYPNPASSDGFIFRVLFVGNFSLRKGAPYILDAWRQLQWRDAELLVLGNIAPEIKQILARWRDVTGIRFLGFTNTLELYQRANVFLFPSLCEGSALVTYEAMACGLPVVVTENAGSLARNGLDGYVIEPASASAIADALERIRSNPTRSVEMGRSASERIAPYTWESYGDRLVEFYRQRV